MAPTLQDLPRLPLTEIFSYLDPIDLLSFSLVSTENAVIVRDAAIVRNLVMDVTLGRMDSNNVTLYNHRNNQFDEILRWGTREAARRNRNEAKITMCDRMIRLQKVRGNVNLRTNNLCLPVRNKEFHIQTVVSFLAFIFPRMTFRDLMIDTDYNSLDYATCLASVTKTESLTLTPSTRGISYMVKSLLSHLEVNRNLHIEEDDIPYMEEYRFRTSEKIFLSNGRFLDGSSLLTMNCVNIEIQKSKFTTHEFLEFLNVWKESNDALTRVANVRIGHPRGVQKLYKDIGAVQWDPTRRPPGYEGGMDIYKPNGLVGTILQYDEVFLFKVWH